MQGCSSVRRQRLLESEPGQLVSKRDSRRLGPEDAGGQALLEPVDVFSADRFEEPELDLSRHDRDGLEERSRLGAQMCGTGQHRVSNGLRDVSRSGCENLGDEEGVPRSRSMELLGVDAVRRRELRDRRRRQRLDLQADHRLVRGQGSEHDPQRMRAVELVVPVAGDHERGNCLDPATQKLQHVECGPVRPVNILENEDRRPVALELGDERRLHLVRPRALADEPFEVASRHSGDVEQGTKRARREQRIARTPQHPCGIRSLAAEAAEQRRLPDSRLARDENEPPARATVSANASRSTRRWSSRSSSS